MKVKKRLLNDGTVKTRKEIAAEYGVSIRTLYRWLKTEKVELPPGLLKPNTVNIIYKKFGRPSE